MTSNPSESPSLEEALVRHAALVEHAVARFAGALVRHESREDLMQGIQMRALERGDSFRWAGEAEFGGWIRRVAASYLNDRRAYWNAARRSAGHQIRIHAEATGTAAPGLDVRSERTGPATLADRREQLELAMQTMSTLLKRDQTILTRDREGATLEELSAELGLGLDAASKARLRARTRFQRAFELLQRSG